jgi:glycosyltransferase involved in cell wall biosynthesis
VKILKVHNTYQQPGGEDTTFRNERRLLQDAGHQVIEYTRCNDEVVALGQLALAKQTIWAEDTRREVRKLLLRDRPDVVHAHNTFVMISPSIFWACHEVGVPVVLTLENYRLLCPGALLLRDGKVCRECMDHGPWRSVRYGCYRQSKKATAVVAAMISAHRLAGTWSHMVDLYVTPTEFGGRVFIEGGLPRQKLVVKPSFVYPDPGEGNRGRSYALFVGRLSPEKGVRTLLAAWATLGIRIPLRIVGDGPLGVELRDYVRQHGLSNVTFLGVLKREEVMTVMKRARCLIFPSECYEGLPNSILEAFACGTPVIASAMGAAQEVVIEGVAGLQFTPGDPRELARRTESAWAHPTRLGEMGRQARREYEVKYSPQRNYELLIQIYDRAIRSRSASRVPWRSRVNRMLRSNATPTTP